MRPDRAMVRERTDALFGPGATVEGAPGGTRAASTPQVAEVLQRADLGLYQRYALHHNGALRAAYERWRAALERVPQVTSLPDPKLTFVQFVEEIQTRTGPQERRYGLSQGIPWFGKLGLRGAVASGEAEEAWQRVVAARLGVERDVALAFFEYAYLARSVLITQGVLDLLRQLEPVVQQRIAGGARGQADLLRLQVEIGRIENDLASLQKLRGPLSARLAAAMNFDDRGALPLPELSEPDLSAVDADALLQRAEERNPGLQELVQRVRTRRAAHELAELSGWPDLTVGVDYFETGHALNPATPGSGDDPVALMVMFDLPIGRTKYRAERRAAEHGLAAASHALADSRAALRAELAHTTFQMEDAGRQVVLYRATLLPRARESLEVTRAAYRAGTATLLDLIDSERVLLGFETGYWRACRDHRLSEARLRAIAGGEVR